MSLIVLGTVALDNITTARGTKHGLLGGSGSHFAVSARHFTEVHLVSTIGQDFPQKHLTFLKKKKINLDSLLEQPGKSFRWDGEYKENDLSHAITHGTELGVLMSYTPQVTLEQRKIPNVFLANFDPNIQSKFLSLMNNPKFVGLDTMNLWIANMRKDLLKLIKKVDLFILNDAEAAELTGETNHIRAAKALSKLGPKFIVIKKGENGVLFYSDKFMFAFPAFPVEQVIDPTGAGDTFAGGIMGYLSNAGKVNEATFRKAAVYATTLSSFNVEGYGHAATKDLTRGKINTRMRKYLKFITP